MKKLTKTTLKSLIKKNAGNLFVRIRAEFDGMVDGVVYSKREFKSAKTTTRAIENSLGLEGVHLVHGSGNFFEAYEDENYVGIEISNCCGCMIVAVRKAA